VYVCAQHTQANGTAAYLLQQGQQEGGGASRSLRAAVSLHGHPSESNWETVVVTSDIAWSVSQLILSLASAITILPFIFQHHTAWLPVSLGINEPKSEKHPPVWGRSEYAFFFGHF